MEFPDDPARVARVMWRLFEPLHAVTYFAPESLAAYEEAGLRGFWRGYFAGRAAPLGPVGPAPVWRAALDSERRLLQPARGWSDQEWDQAAGRLEARSWLDAGGLPTTAGVAVRDEVEARTDALAAGPWRALGRPAAARLAQLLRPLAVEAAVALPFPNPIGLPAPVT